MGTPVQRSKGGVVLTRIADRVYVGIVGGGNTSLTLEEARQLAGGLLELSDDDDTETSPGAV